VTPGADFAIDVVNILVFTFVWSPHRSKNYVTVLDFFVNYTFKREAREFYTESQNSRGWKGPLWVI